MITRFKTEHGSIYEIDYDLKTWKCIDKAQDNDPLGLRTMEGVFNHISPIELGYRVDLYCIPLTTEASFRYISTSPVVGFEVL